MKIAMVGLGRMGMNMARRLLQNSIEVVAYNRTYAKVKEIVAEGAEGAESLQELVDKLPDKKVVWLMLPAGETVDEHINELIPMLSAGDIIIDGGNSNFKDDMKRSEKLATNGIEYVDAGVSGGVWGLKIGYCLMVGGSRPIYDYLEPVFRALAPENGYLYCGENGSGHFVKMVHNGIEYGMMQAYGEGFAILEASQFADNFNYEKIADLWNHGSVIRSWLLELLVDAFNKDPKLTQLKGYVDDSGEGRWTVLEAVNTGVSAPVITSALFRRFESRQDNAFENRLLAALRNEFGGHAVVSAKK